MESEGTPPAEREPRGSGAIDEVAEEEAAAREAAEIGGPDPDPGRDPAERPVVEAGGGVSEGFEEAERELEDRASHKEPGGYPPADADARAEDGRATPEYGEADEALSQEER